MLHTTIGSTYTTISLYAKLSLTRLVMLSPATSCIMSLRPKLYRPAFHWVNGYTH